MKRPLHTRALVVCVAMAAAFTVFSLRLVYLEVARHDHYAALATKNHLQKVTIWARRGLIRDRHGELLAGNLPVKTVAADPRQIGGPAKVSAVARILAEELDRDEKGICARLSGAESYVVIKRRVPETVIDRLRARLVGPGMAGIYYEPDSARVYPNGPVLCHVLGFVGGHHSGVCGIERSQNGKLIATDGYRHIERNGRGREMPHYRGQEKPAVDGHDVTLTIDMGLQNIVEREVDIAMANLRPQAMVVILTRPATGEILALACRPAFDLRAPAAGGGKGQANLAVAAQYEPGSTFKIVVVAGALNEGIVSADTKIHCENGALVYPGHTLRDHGRGYGELTVLEILSKSSNIGAAKLALQLGQERFFAYIRRFGFGQPTGIELPLEQVGTVRPPEAWDKLSILTIPMGQGIAVVPIQTLAAASVFANDGRLVPPRIIRSINRPDGTEVYRLDGGGTRQVIAAQAAADVRRALEMAVGKTGTAALAAIPGFRVAGKTGTAQKPRVRERGNEAAFRPGYEPGKYVASFVGFFPAERPELLGLVLIDEPRAEDNVHYGGVVAAPVFARIGAQAARHLGIRPTEDVARAVGARPISAEAAAEGR